MNRVFVDSDVLIDVLRQLPVALNALNDLRPTNSLLVSVVVRMEVVVGSFNKEALQQTERLLRQLTLVPITEEISTQADQLVTKFCLGNGLKLADALIAATALVYNAPLLTKNQRDFRFIPSLQLLPYPTA